MNDSSKDIKSLESGFIISVLKYATNEEHPLSAKEIAVRMQNLTTESHDEKTVLRKLRSMCMLSESDNTELPARVFALTYGGYVRAVSFTVSGDTKNPKPQYKFYFEPFLQPSDISMLYSTLASNRYIAPQEKEHLLSTLQVLTPERYIEEKEIQFHFPEEPIRYVPRKGQVKYIDLLNTVKILYEAIQEKKRVSVVYGNYTLDEKFYRQITFKAKNQKKPYVLNPYALFWNHGFYYLLATYGNYTDLMFFRVDRIVSVEYYRHEESEHMKRAPIPETLKKYYRNLGTEEEYFDSETYTAVHPLMLYSGEEKLIECFLECDSSSLGLLVDTFGSVEILGKHIQILESNITHPEDVDENGEPIRFFTVRIPQVQYENIRAFCLQNHHLITAISPPKLALDILKVTSNSSLKYARILNALVEDEGGEINPFVMGNNPLVSLLESMGEY